MKPAFLISTLTLLVSCVAPQPMPVVSKVDLPRFMGAWYVIANIPTPLETGAHNAVESYALNGDGSIQTIFTFRDGAFNGKEKRYNPTGFVVNKDTNSEWSMQFLWPFKSEFLISYLTEDYGQTVIARTKRDYVWIMARAPTIPEPEFQKIVAFLETNGYDTKKIERVPQKWDAPK
ncbi:MAG: lipocalin family protein [Spirochaetia bacterium]|nr:lipocalin family protein [Spirochaetia bacterium]